MPVVTTEYPSRVYLTSSPSNGVETVREGYVAKDPGSELYGDSKLLPGQVSICVCFVVVVFV